MSEPRYISPMLDGFSLGQSISDHHGVECYPAMRDDSDKRFIVKKISLPASQVQVDALLLTGVFRDTDAVLAYYKDLAQGVLKEVQTLNSLAEQRGFVPTLDCQIVPMESGVGFEVYILSRYRKSLDRFVRRHPMTHLGAVNLGIDLCAAMAVCREAGWLYVDLKPENIFLFGDQEYRIGDLGFVAMDSLRFASLPDRYRSIYTAPEVADAYASLNATMDTYALGLVLYQIYNCGKLPFDGPEGRTAWLEGLAAGGSIEPPCCADEDMSGIILKACALNPDDRWQTPAEMGHALISYMQRNGAEDIPIAASAEPEPEENGAEEESEAASSESVVEEISVESTEEPSNMEESSAESDVDSPIVEESDFSEADSDGPEEELPAEEIPDSDPVEEIPAEEAEETPAVEKTDIEAPADPPDVEENVDFESESDASVGESPDESEEEAVSADWIDLMDAFLAEEEGTVEPQIEEGEPTLRELLSVEELLPGDEDLHEEDLSAEAADILNIAQELIEHEAPTPVVVPDPVDLPIPEPIAPEPEEEKTEENQEEVPEEDTAGDTDVPAVPELPAVTDEKRSGILRRIIKTVTALALAAGLTYGTWYYYQNIYLQTIDAMKYSGTGTQVTVTVTTDMDHSKLTVICKDTYGNAVEGTLENGAVTFSDLVPGSQYIISLEPLGFHKLTGATSVTYSTPAETQIINLTAVTGQEPGSAIINFGIEGRDVDQWTLTYAAEGMEPQSVTFTGHTVTVNELTVGTAYTFTLTAPHNVLLVGENVITHTAGDLVQASDLVLSDYADGIITVTWTAPEGVNRWIVRCSDGAGYDQLQEVEGNIAAFQGITDGGKYTVEVTAATQTLGIRTEITAAQSSISGFTATLNGSMAELSWDSTGEVPCTIACCVDGNVLQVITPEANTATYGPVAPGTTYTFNITPVNGSADVPAGTAALEVPAAGTFSANKLDAESIIVEMFDVPTKSDWSYGTLQRAREQDTFKPSGSLALLYTVTKPYNFDSAEFETLFVIRDSEEKLVSVSSRTRVWDDMWDNGYCTEQVSNLPAEAGDYTLSIYIANGLLAQLPFSVK